MTVSRLAFLDALRFVAAAAVLFQHLVEIQGELGHSIAALLSPGVFGVVLFFIISGFVMPFAAGSNFNAGSFIIRRVFRIYPLVLVVFAIVGLVALTGALPDLSYISAASAKDWIANVFLVQDYVGARPVWGVTWTLSLEITWYILFAFSLSLIGRNFDFWLARAAPVIILGLAVLSLLLDHRLPLGRLGMIYAAIFGCRVYRYYSGRSSANELMIDTVLFVGTMALCNMVSFGYFSHPNITLSESLYPWIAATFLFLFVSVVPAVRMSAPVNNRVIGYLGAVSFSTYLLHPLAIALFSMMQPAWIAIIATILATYLFSALGYVFVERPSQKMGKQVAEVMVIKTAVPESSVV